MPEYATSGSGGQQGRRPLTGHAGEVTRRAGHGVEEEDTGESPPPFNGPKIGGAKDRRRAEVLTLPNGSIEKTNHLADIGGMRINDLALHHQTKVPVEAPIGKKRLWVAVNNVQRDDWEADPNIWVSNTCKQCFESNVVCSGWEAEETPANFTACGKVKLRLS